MNNEAFAAALHKLADIKYMEADALNEWAAALVTGAPVSAPAGRAATPPADEFGDIPSDYGMDGPSPAPLPKAAEPAGPQGSLGQCPKHKVEYADGRYGPYCKQQSDEGPDWANAKGYCRITPKNASAWLRQHAGAAV